MSPIAKRKRVNLFGRCLTPEHEIKIKDNGPYPTCLIGMEKMVMWCHQSVCIKNTIHRQTSSDMITQSDPMYQKIMPRPSCKLQEVFTKMK